MKTIYDPSYRKLITWLTAERKASGLSQPELAKKLKFPSHSYVSKIESCERKIDVVEFVRICETLNIDPKTGIDLLTSKPKAAK